MSRSEDSANVPDPDIIAAEIETRSLPALTRCYPCSFTFYVAHPIHSIVEDLQAALPEFAEIASDLTQRSAITGRKDGKKVGRKN
ncbi:MAG TPA: hypothetical protein VGM65_00140 [Candidatus Udaeobacter sp.]|jgi:hypothetical protein